MSIRIKISGVNGVISGLDKFEKEIQHKISEEVSGWAKRTEEDAKRDVPVDTGALKSSIRSVVGADRTTWIVKAGGINNVDYAPYVAFGTGAFVDEAFLQEFGLVQYAAQFKGRGERLVNLPMRDFLYRNARTEFNKTVTEIKKIIESSWK